MTEATGTPSGSPTSVSLGTTYATVQQTLSAMLPKTLEATDKNLQRDFLQFKVNVTHRAMVVLQDTIPKKIQKFNAMMPVMAEVGVTIGTSGLQRCEADLPPPYDGPTESSTNRENQSLDASIEGSRKRLKVEMPGGATSPGGTEGSPWNYIYTHHISKNKQLGQMINEAKTEWAEIMEIVAIVKLWIQLNIPKIEDGNNFGVAIQEEAIQELVRVEDAAFAQREAIIKYFTARGKLVTKVTKYPNVEDYRESVYELDEKQYQHLKISSMDLRNNYSILYDLLHKNWLKIIQPRPSDTNRMVY